MMQSLVPWLWYTKKQRWVQASVKSGLWDEWKRQGFDNKGCEELVDSCVRQFPKASFFLWTPLNKELVDEDTWVVICNKAGGGDWWKPTAWEYRKFGVDFGKDPVSDFHKDIGEVLSDAGKMVTEGAASAKTLMSTGAQWLLLPVAIAALVMWLSKR